MRAFRLSASGLLAITCAVAIGCAQQSTQDQADTHGQSGTCGDHSCKTSALELRDQMRQLWTDHVAYTRFYIIEAIANLPQAQNTAARLLNNQDAIGDAIKPFYGEDAGNELARLLRDHIQGAVAVLEAAKANDQVALRTATDAWFANADDIAQFLANANPAWDLATMKDMMHTHLNQTIAEATAQLTGDFNADVVAFDGIVAHILDMADMLTQGIAAQFPDKIDTTEQPGQDLHLQMRKLWEDHVIYTRNVIMASLAVANASGSGSGCSTTTTTPPPTTLPDFDAVLARLLQNQVDIGNAVRPYAGDAVAKQLTTLLTTHITLAGDILFAAKANDTATVQAKSALWYQNADEIAALLAKVLNQPLADMQLMMKTHLDLTLAEATDYLTAKFDASIRDYDSVVGEILQMADGISAAITVIVGANQ
jgi:hypothetical protein